jgi:hypothetical protein
VCARARVCVRVCVRVFKLDDGEADDQKSLILQVLDHLLHEGLMQLVKDQCVSNIASHGAVTTGSRGTARYVAHAQRKRGRSFTHAHISWFDLVGTVLTTTQTTRQ